jgi:hypothetical protein
MSREQVLQFFDKEKALLAIAQMRQAVPKPAKAH